MGLTSNRVLGDTRKVALYISPMGMDVNNGMLQRQHQLLSSLCDFYPNAVDVLSLYARPSGVRRWLQFNGLKARALNGIFPLLARLNAIAWYGCGAILCNKLSWSHHFQFPITTPLPESWVKRYSKIVCYYPWAFKLLELTRAGKKVVVDLGDVMADRHERIGTKRWISLASSDERSIVKSSAQCLAISEGDKKEFKRLYGVELPVVTFVPPEHRNLFSLVIGPRPRSVGFIGAPSYLNEQILITLADPAFLGCLSKAGINLVIAGGICHTASRTLVGALSQGGAHVLGHIKSIHEFYALVGTVLNPVGPSTGIKIKSVEALMAGRNLVTTRFGVDASHFDAFCDQIVLIDWPVSPGVLGELSVRTVERPNVSIAPNFSTYVNTSVRSLAQVLTTK